MRVVILLSLLISLSIQDDEGIEPADIERDNPGSLLPVEEYERDHPRPQLPVQEYERNCPYSQQGWMCSVSSGPRIYNTDPFEWNRNSEGTTGMDNNFDCRACCYEPGTTLEECIFPECPNEFRLSEPREDQRGDQECCRYFGYTLPQCRAYFVPVCSSRRIRTQGGSDCCLDEGTTLPQCCPERSTRRRWSNMGRNDCCMESGYSLKVCGKPRCRSVSFQIIENQGQREEQRCCLYEGYNIPKCNPPCRRIYEENVHIQGRPRNQNCCEYEGYNLPQCIRNSYSYDE